MTLEDLLDDVSTAAALDYPENVTVSVSMHHIDGELLREFVDAYPELVASKQVNYDGARVVHLHSHYDRPHAVVLFTDAVPKGAW